MSAAHTTPPPARARAEPFGADVSARHRRGKRFERLALGATLFGLAVLVVLLGGILLQGLGALTPDFLTNFPSRRPADAGFKAAIAGSLWVIGLTAFLSIPVGVAAAIYLEEYATKGRLSQVLHIVISNLAGVPSILYGMLGLVAFVRMFDVFPDDFTLIGVPLPLGRSVLAGALTLMLLILPIIIIATREALRGVPDALRHAAYGLGATRWQCVRHHVLPAATPGILTGVILALSRALGETAPLIMIGALTYVAFVPRTPYDPFTAMPIQIFNWASRPQAAFHEVAGAGCIVLLAVLLGMNALAIVLRDKAEKRRRT